MGLDNSTETRYSEKLYISRLGPYKVLKHHTNGDIIFEKEPFVTDKANIRRTYPYHKKHTNEVD